MTSPRDTSEPNLPDGFLELVGQFCADLSGVRNLSPATVKSYGSDLRIFGSWCHESGIDPLACDHRQLRLYLASDEEGHSRRSVNRHLSAIKAFYRWLGISGKGAQNPASVLQGPKMPKTLPHSLTSREMNALLSVYAEDKSAEGLRNQALLEFLYACGARVSEASNLRLSWLELGGGFVRITGKGNKQRIVPLHSRSVDALDAYLRDGRRHLVRGQQCQDYVFLSTRGNQMSPTAIRRVFKRALTLAGIDPSSTPHTVRHTFASDLLVGGADLRSVQELLGHASLSTTQVYTHLAPERLRDIHHKAHPRG